MSDLEDRRNFLDQLAKLYIFISFLKRINSSNMRYEYFILVLSDNSHCTCHRCGICKRADHHSITRNCLTFFNSRYRRFCDNLVSSNISKSVNKLSFLHLAISLDTSNLSHLSEFLNSIIIHHNYNI